jgi:hypothetical protein
VTRPGDDMAAATVLFDAETARVTQLQRDTATARRPMGWELDQRGLSVIWSVYRELDGRVWLHASMAQRDRVPTWDELKELKDWLIASDRYAYQVLPPISRYVNLHPHVLHLWAVVDGPEPLPDFLRGGSSL